MTGWCPMHPPLADEALSWCVAKSGQAVATANTLPEIAGWSCTRLAKFFADLCLVGQRVRRLCRPFEQGAGKTPPPCQIGRPQHGADGLAKSRPTGMGC